MSGTTFGLKAMAEGADTNLIGKFGVEGLPTSAADDVSLCRSRPVLPTSCRPMTNCVQVLFLQSPRSHSRGI